MLPCRKKLHRQRCDHDRPRRTLAEPGGSRVLDRAAQLRVPARHGYKLQPEPTREKILSRSLIKSMSSRTLCTQTDQSMFMDPRCSAAFAMIPATLRRLSQNASRHGALERELALMPYSLPSESSGCDCGDPVQQCCSESLRTCVREVASHSGAPSRTDHLKRGLASTAARPLDPAGRGNWPANLGAARIIAR